MIDDSLIQFELSDSSGSNVGIEIGPAARYDIDGYADEYELLSIDDFEKVLGAAVGPDCLGSYLGRDVVALYGAGRSHETWVYSGGIVKIVIREDRDGHRDVESFRFFYFRKIEARVSSCRILATAMPEDLVVEVTINKRRFLALNQPNICESASAAGRISAAGPIGVDYPCP